MGARHVDRPEPALREGVELGQWAGAGAVAAPRPDPEPRRERSWATRIASASSRMTWAGAAGRTGPERPAAQARRTRGSIDGDVHRCLRLSGDRDLGRHADAHSGHRPERSDPVTTSATDDTWNCHEERGCSSARLPLPSMSQESSRRRCGRQTKQSAYFTVLREFRFPMCRDRGRGVLSGEATLDPAGTRPPRRRGRVGRPTWRVPPRPERGRVTSRVEVQQDRGGAGRARWRAARAVARAVLLG